ncbi:hypothetical protein HU200_037678 [Digitaria exilis]|uniref:Uncharacterized protein n=1 Tax=Digitaria exilis TaxID=1010633 RepID=A0A835EJ24_9POAL|nr:hypothetical protein HU200_037678 [Digitaria exilis]CAB3453535.1 unnamed protein product [Digitaria exilis]
MAGSSSTTLLLALPEQVMSGIRGVQLESHLDIKAVVPSVEINVQVDDKTVRQANPEYTTWVAKDQQVPTHKTMAAIWAAVEVIFSSQTKAHAMNTRIALTTTQKGSLTMVEYIAKMKTLVDDMTMAGKPLEDDDVISYVLTGLDSDYNPITTMVVALPRQTMPTAGVVAAAILVVSVANLHDKVKGRGSNNNTRSQNPRGNNNNNNHTAAGTASRKIMFLMRRPPRSHLLPSLSIEDAMGTLGGHVAPGAFFFLIGLWQLFGHTRLFLLQRSSYVAPVWFPVRGRGRGIRHIELVMIIVGSVISISMELFIVQAKHQPLDDDGTIPSVHLHNFEHASISLAWLVFAAATIHMDRARTPMRDAVSQLVAAAAFAQQLLIFHFHSADHTGVQGQYHRLLELVIAVTLATSLLLIPHQRSIVLSLVRSASLVFQGVWFAVMGVMMWTPALVPKGCFINDEEGLEVVRCRSQEALDRAKSLVNLQFYWYMTGTVAFVVVFYLQMAKMYQEQQPQYVPLVVKGGSGRGFSIGEIRDEEDDDFGAAKDGLGHEKRPARQRLARNAARKATKGWTPSELTRRPPNLLKTPHHFPSTVQQTQFKATINSSLSSRPLPISPHRKAMGTLVGHVAPGAGFLLIGLWHLFSHTRLFLLRPRSYTAPVWFPVRGVRHLELILIIIGTAMSILMELVIGPERHQPFDLDGTIPSNHLHNFEHASISLGLLLFAALTIHMDRAVAPNRDAVSQLVAAAAFAQQLLIFHLHSADHMGVEGQFHWLLQTVIAVTLATTLLGIPCPRSFTVSLVRSGSLVFQGVWFIAMGVMLWTPGLVPKGCFLNREEGHDVVRCRTDEALERAKSLVNLQFSWYMTCTVVFVVISYLLLTKLYPEEPQYVPLVMGGSSGRDSDGHDDEDDDLEAAKRGFGQVRLTRSCLFGVTPSPSLRISLSPAPHASDTLRGVLHEFGAIEHDAASSEKCELHDGKGSEIPLTLLLMHAKEKSRRDFNNSELL